MNEKLQEYEMLRKEILQYLGEYQAVRNMMYIITVTILGFALSGDNRSEYIYLLPVIVIFPSYLISMNYWKCTNKAAAYLLVFYERTPGCPYQWETLHRKFNKEYNAMPKNDFQHLPYIVCWLICVILYFIHIDYTVNPFPNVIIGVVIVVIGIYSYERFKNIDYDGFIEAWERVKNEGHGYASK